MYEYRLVSKIFMRKKKAVECYTDLMELGDCAVKVVQEHEHFTHECERCRVSGVHLEDFPVRAARFFKLTELPQCGTEIHVSRCPSVVRALRDVSELESLLE